jgi:hypothetical protein
MLTTIMAALARIQGSVNALDQQVRAVEKPTPRPKPKPAAAAAVFMPAKPTVNKQPNPVIDLKTKVTTPHLPKPIMLVPATPPPRVDDLEAFDDSVIFESYCESYDNDFPQSSAQRPTPVQAAQAKAAEWVEVRTQPNHHRGIINLDYATVARSEQVRSRAAQVTQAQNRTPQGGPQRRPTDRAAPDETIITIVHNGGSDNAQEKAAI